MGKRRGRPVLSALCLPHSLQAPRGSPDEFTGSGPGRRLGSNLARAVHKNNHFRYWAGWLKKGATGDFF